MDLYRRINTAHDLINRGQYHDAKQLMVRYIRIEGYNKDVLMIQAFCHHALGEYEEGIEVYDEILSHELDPDALNNKGHLLNELGRPMEALESFERCNLLFPMYVNAWSNKGRSLAALGRYNESFEAYQHALIIEPNHQDALFGLDYVSKFVTINEEPVMGNNYETESEAENYHRIGLNFYHQEKFDLAIETYNEALKLEPFNKDILLDKRIALHDKAVNLYDEGLFDEAEKAFNDILDFADEVLESNPYEDSVITAKLYTYRDLANIYINKEDFSQALEYYELYASSVVNKYRLNPNQQMFKEEAANALAVKAGLLNVLGRKNEAMSTINDAIDIEETDIVLQYNNIIYG